MESEPEIQWGHWFACVALSLGIALFMLWHMRPGGPIRRQLLHPRDTLHQIRWNLEHPLPLQAPAPPPSRPVHLVPRRYVRPMQ